MPDNHPTLSDILAVPCLLEQCVPRWEGPHSIRTLRCVSKEVGSTAMRAVEDCIVQLGEGACLEARQVVRMMRFSALQELTVTLVTTSGRPGPTLAQQLATCTSHVQELVQGLGTALSSVTQLILKHRHELWESSRSKASTPSTGPLPAATCPVAFTVVARSVCTLLAAALPHLRSLAVEGSCRDAALAAFGASCPKLTSLEIEAISMPIQALKDLDRLLPKLGGLSLTSPTVCTATPQQLVEYVGACLHALQRSTSLRCMSVCFSRKVVLDCNRVWEQAPPNLRVFGTGCQMQGIHHATALLRGLHHMTIQHNADLDVFQLINAAPDLKQLYVNSPSTWLLRCNHASTASSIVSFRERVRNGLRFRIETFHLVGLSESVEAALESLPPLRNVRKCVLHFISNPRPQCLDHVARTLPDIAELTLLSLADLFMLDDDFVELSAEQLEPLAACASLERLSIHIPLDVDTTDLVELCMRMPRLKVLGYCDSPGVDITDLRSAFAAHGRALQVQDYSL